MGSKSRNKGKAGEREFLNLLGEELGMRLSRNLNQADEGGADNTQLPGWAIEIKRAATPKFNTWWEQACNQAKEHDYPALAYRLDRQDWFVVVPIGAIHPGFIETPFIRRDMAATLSISGFAAIVREHMAGQEAA